MGLGKLRAGQEKLCCLPVLLPPVCPHGAFFAELHGKAGDPSDNVVGGVKELSGLIVLALRGLKPAADALQLAPVVLCDRFRIHCLHPWNGRFIGIDLFQHTVAKRRTELGQQFLDDADITLQCRDKVPKVLHQLVLKQQELLSMHHFLGAHTAEIPDVVMIILVKTREIPLQLVPEVIGLRRCGLCHFRKALQRSANTFQQRGLQRASLDLQLFKPQHQTLNFYTIWRHLIAKALALELLQRAHMPGVLQRFQVVPVHQRGQILLALLRAIFPKFRKIPQRLKDLLLVHPAVQLLCVFIKKPHDAAVAVRIFRIEILHLRQRLQQPFRNLQASVPFRGTCPPCFIKLLSLYLNLTFNATVVL